MVIEYPPGVVRSRRLLVEVIKAVQVFPGAFTVIGAHGIHVWTGSVLGVKTMQETRDADTVVDPQFVAADPRIIDVLSGLGLEPAIKDRPGIYGLVAERCLRFDERTTVDVIVPDTYAGPGRRSAAILGQEKAATRAVGVELALWDRHMMTLTTFDDPVESIDAYVAGPTALLIAKAWKVGERVTDVDRPYRVRPKDSGDIALLMGCVTPQDAAETVARHVRDHPEIGRIVSQGVAYLMDLYGDVESPALAHAVAVGTVIDPLISQMGIMGWVDGLREGLRSTWLGDVWRDILSETRTLLSADTSWEREN